MREALNKLGLNVGTITTIIGLLISTVYFFVDSKSSRETVKTLAESNKTLVETVARHEGQISSFNNAVMMFMNNPPGLLMNELKELEEDVRRHHPEHSPDEETADIEEVSPPGGN